MSKKTLFNIFSNLDKKDSHGLTRLYRAARHGDKERVKSLLKKGANPNAATNCGLTPLHIACFWGEIEIVKMLLNANANPDIDNGQGWSPLHSASLTAGLEHRQEIIRILIEDYKADRSQKDHNGWTACDYASLWTSPDDNRLSLILDHLRANNTEKTGHVPDLKKAGLNHRPPKKIKKGQFPRHH